MCGTGGTPQIQDTEDVRAQQQINAELWQYYTESYKPLIEKYKEMVTEPTREEAQEKKVAGQIRGEIMKNVTPETASENPVVTAKRLSGLAKKETGAQIQGQGAVRSRKLGELQNIIDIGRGQETTAQAGLGELAGESIRSEISRENTEQIAQAAEEETYGSLAGAMAAGLLAYKSPAKARTLNWNPQAEQFGAPLR